MRNAFTAVIELAGPTPGVALVAAAITISVFTARATGQSNREHKLACTPAVLTSGEKLTIRFPLPHPAELSIFAPDGTEYLVVYQPLPSSGVTPFVDEESFRKMAKLELPVSTAMAWPFVYGRTGKEPVFQKPGTYKVLLADTIHTDAEQDVYRCKVEFKSR